MRIDDEIKQKQFKSPFQKAIINLFFTESWVQNKFKTFFKQFGITSQQYNVLRILKGHHPNSYTAGQIKEVMVDKTPDLTRLLDRLQAKKLVGRKICEWNRRQLEIVITPEGLDLLDSIGPIQDNLMTDINNLSDQEAEQLSQLLDKLRG